MTSYIKTMPVADLPEFFASLDEAEDVRVVTRPARSGGPVTLSPVLTDVHDGANNVRMDTGDGDIYYDKDRHVMVQVENRRERGAQSLFDACHDDAVRAGWWVDPEGRDLVQEAVKATSYGKLVVAGKLALIHSEVSEAMEGHRKGLRDDHLPHRDATEVELADAIIRIADLAGALGYDLRDAVVEKMAYNRKREDHGTAARRAAGGKSY